FGERLPGSRGGLAAIRIVASRRVNIVGCRLDKCRSTYSVQQIAQQTTGEPSHFVLSFFETIGSSENSNHEEDQFQLAVTKRDIFRRLEGNTGGVCLNKLASSHSTIRAARHPI